MRVIVLLAAVLLLAGAPARNQPGREGVPEAVLRAVRSPQSLPDGRYTLARTWQTDGREASHEIGRAVADPEAEGGRAWEARVTRDSPRELLYGPYITLAPGDYVAFVRMKLLEEAGEETVAILDAGVSFGQNLLANQEIAGSDLALGHYVEVPIAFHYPGGQLEVRVLWRGYSSLRVDRVSLFRREGGGALPPPIRAPQPTPSGNPKNLTIRAEPRPFPDPFPRSLPPASHLLVADLRREVPDRQMLALTLQGIVNRTRPRVYCLFNPTDAFWLDRMRGKKWIRSVETVAGPEALVRRFRREIRGVIVTDPGLPASKNVATMLAGVHGGVVVSPRLAKRLALPVIADLRGRWRTNVAAYRWAFDHLWGRLNHHVIACSYPDHLGLRDYLVQHRVFIFWLSGPIDGAKPVASPNDEIRLMEALFARMPANIPVMSYPWAGKDVGIGEGPGVTLFAEFGKYLVGSIDASNLSVHSGIRIPRFRQRRAPAPPRLRRDRVYVSFVISDGDNLPVLATSNFPQFWKDRRRGTFPIGWTITPAACLLVPDIVDYYYSTATPADAFLGAVSGFGYTYPDTYASRFRQPDRARLFDGFLDQTRTYMARMDLSSLWIMNASRPEIIARYAERIPTLDGLFPDYGRRVLDYEDAVYPTARNTPVFHAVTDWEQGLPREQQIASVVARIHAMTPAARPAFLHLFVLNWFADLPMLEEVLRRLGPGYVAVRPDHLAALYREELRRTRIYVRAPTALAAIEGQPLVFTAALQNVTPRPLDVGLSVTGLQSATLRSARARLAPNQSPVSVTVSGSPIGGNIRLRLTGAFGIRDFPISVRRVAAREIAAPLPSGTALRFVRRYEAEELPHRSGKAASDPAAGGGRVWSARPEETEPGYIVYGPYVPVPAGCYVALFRLKRTGEGQGPLVTLDAAPAGGGTTAHAEQEIRAADLPLGAYRSFPLLFRHAGGQLETRVLWPGGVPVDVDSVTLWEIVAR